MATRKTPARRRTPMARMKLEYPVTKHQASTHDTDAAPPPPITNEGGGTTKPVDPVEVPAGSVPIELLTADRHEPGTMASIPEAELGFVVNVGGVTYTHVSNRARDGVWQFAPVG